MKRLVLVVLVCAVGCGKPTDPAISELANHKFWNKPQSSEQIEAIVSCVMSLDRTKYLTVNADGLVNDQTDANTQRDLSKVFKRRIICFDMADYYQRPTRLQVLRDFLSELNRAEFLPKQNPPVE